jgi:hypothetical protein
MPFALAMTLSIFSSTDESPFSTKTLRSSSIHVTFAPSSSEMIRTGTIVVPSLTICGAASGTSFLPLKNS